jgi:Cys-rich repeat protein
MTWTWQRAAIALTAVLYALFSLALVGCKASGSNPECMTDSDCPSGRACIDEKCVGGGCTLDSECQAGKMCQQGRCVTRPECRVDLDCMAGSVCLGGICVDPDEPDGGVDGGDEDEGVNLSESTTVVDAAWGDGPEDLGHLVPDEASPEGPASFVVADDGTIHILDQLNRRIQVFDAAGTFNKTISISESTFSDIDLGQNDQLVLLDLWRNKAVVFIDQWGQQTGSVELVGDKISRSNEVFCLYSHADGVWVDTDGSLVRISDAASQPDPNRPVVGGRFSHDGKHLLTANKIGAITVTVTRKGVGQGSIDHFSAHFDIPVLYPTLIASDASGNIYLGVTLLEDNVEPPYTLEQSREEVVVFNANGVETRRLTLPISAGMEEVTRSIRVAGNGAVFQLVLGVNGATVRRYDP